MFLFYYWHKNHENLNKIDIIDRKPNTCTCNHIRQEKIAQIRFMTLTRRIYAIINLSMYFVSLGGYLLFDTKWLPNWPSGLDCLSPPKGLHQCGCCQMLQTFQMQQKMDSLQKVGPQGPSGPKHQLKYESSLCRQKLCTNMDVIQQPCAYILCYKLHW